MDSTVISWLVAGVGFVLNTAIVALITAIVTKRVERRYEERDQKEEERRSNEAKLAELQETEKARHMEEMMNRRCDTQVCTIREEMKKIDVQLAQSLIDIRSQLTDLHDSTLCSLRDDILNSYWRCHDWQKCRSEWDTSNMEALYEQYHRLHGNSFVDHLMEEFYKIPLKNNKE